MIEKLEGKKARGNERRLENDWIGFILWKLITLRWVVPYCLNYDILCLMTKLLIIINNTATELYIYIYLFLKFYSIKRK